MDLIEVPEKVVNVHKVIHRATEDAFSYRYGKDIDIKINQCRSHPPVTNS